MSMAVQITRRRALTFLLACAALPVLPAGARVPTLDRLALCGPPAGPSVTLAYAVKSGKFADIAKEATFTAWRNPDELRAGLTSGSVLISVVPVQAAANLYNQGFPIRLLNAMTDGLLYVISGSPEVNGIVELAVEALAVAVLPGRSWRDEQGLDPKPAEPMTDRLGDELRSIVRADVLRWPLLQEQLCQHMQDILAVELALHMDG